MPNSLPVAFTSGTVDEEARAQGCRDEMWQSQEVCVASSVFPLYWGYSQPVPISIYGSKQDANSGKEVKCHMQLNYPVVCSQSQTSRLLWAQLNLNQSSVMSSV